MLERPNPGTPGSSDDSANRTGFEAVNFCGSEFNEQIVGALYTCSKDLAGRAPGRERRGVRAVARRRRVGHDLWMI